MTPDQLKAFRTAKGWTQKDLALQLGYSLRSVKRWESGEDMPKVVLLAIKALRREK